MANHAAFLRENIFDGADVTTDSEASNYPVTDVLERRHDLPWRTVASTATIFIDCLTDQTANAMMIRVPSERDPDLQPIPPMVTVDPADTITIRAGDQLGAPYTKEYTFAAGHHPRLGYIPHVFRDGLGEQESVTAQFWEIEFVCANAWFEVEYVQAGTLWTPGFNVNRGNVSGIDEEANKAKSAFSGGTFAEARSRLVKFTGNWSVWTTAELDEWEEFILSHGITKPFSLFRKITGDMSKRATICTFDKAPTIPDQTGAHFEVRAIFEENR